MKAKIAGEISSAVTHLTALGLAQIAVDAGCTGVRTWWDDGVSAIAQVSWDGDLPVGEVVRKHVAKHDAANSWTQAVFDHLGKATAVFSPRIKAPTDEESWHKLLTERRTWLDQDDVGSLDHLMIGALGEQAYWLCDDPNGISDRGASRWEMKTRNSGEEFVQHRLVKLCGALSNWTAEELEAGVKGLAARDTIGKDLPASRTPTGLKSEGPLDNAVAWCALWGIAGLQTIPKNGRLSASVGVSPAFITTHPRTMALPVFVEKTHPALWRAVAASAQFAEHAFGDGRPSGASDWLRSHHVAAIARFATVVAGSKTAPERYLLAGQLEVL